MRTITMKLGLSAITLLFCLGMMAQKGAGKERRAMIQQKKVAYCNEQAGLTEKEAEAYWAIDAQLHDEKKAIRKELKDVKDIDIDTASDSEIEGAIRKGMNSKVEIAELENSYVNRFLEVLSPKKLALMKKAERSFKKEVLKDLKGSGRPGPGGKK